MDMVFMNDGLLPTFSRRASQSFIDVTFSTQEVSKNITKWEVLDEESLSDHRYIYFEMNTKSKTKKIPSVRHTPFVDIDKFGQSLAAHLKEMPASNCISVKQYTEALSGHGPFRAYRHRVGRTGAEDCRHCTEVDTVEHTLFVCAKWQSYRQVAEEELSENITPDNMVQIMMTGEAKWRTVHIMLLIKQHRRVRNKIADCQVVLFIYV
nr:unnamed protein product [Callosobruchus chinensis]